MLNDVNGDVWLAATVGIKPHVCDIFGVPVTWAALARGKNNNSENLTFDLPQLLLPDISIQRLNPQLHQDL